MKNKICILLGIIFFGLFAISSCSSYKEAEELIALKTDSIPDLVDYNLHIRPILSDKCFNCHGPDKNKIQGDLQLHTFEFATKNTKGHSGIVPRNLSKSEVMRRILSEDPELKMPLVSSNLSLTDLEKAILAKWIKQGAEYKPHWAFIKPETQKIPSPKTPNVTVNNAIDNFIIAKMETQGLKPSPEATKEKLARRVYIDLTGLPPSIQELEQFLKDNSTSAYEKLVDKLIAKPQYGERMASEWMDVARYADSHGYQDDGNSNMWPWRDWAIKAFNKNMPYNQFITEQLAGDLLPKATKEQILATGFNRNHMINSEGGIIDEEFRTEYVLDRVNTTGKAFLGLTVECSRCHDHKYDPISQKEFYQLSSFFNHLNEAGKGNLYENSTGPTLLLTDEATDQKLKEVREKILQQTSLVNKLEKNAQINIPDADTKKWDDTFKKHVLASFSFEPSFLKDSVILNSADKSKSGKLSKTIHFENGKIGKALSIDGDEATQFSGEMYDFERTQPFSVSMWIKVPKYSEKGYSLFLNCASIYHGFRGYELLLKKNKLNVRLSSAYPSNSIEVVSKDSISSKTWTHVAFSYDGSSKAEGINLFINGKQAEKEILLNDLYRTIRTHTLAADRKENAMLSELQKKRPLTLKETKRLSSLSFESWYSKQPNFVIGGRKDQGVQPFFDGAIDELKIYDKSLQRLEIKAEFESKKLSEIIKNANKNEVKELIKSYFYPELKRELNNLRALREHENNIILPLEEIKVMKDRPQKRETFILNRGTYDAPTDKVEEGAVEAVLPYGKEFPKNRLGLAQWLTHKDNPLTARVVVNRYWQMIFGMGLVTTSADFGNQGNMPTHPELLDYLCIEFVNSDWDVKKLIKMMVCSSTYKQSSIITKEALQNDPQNMLYARASRYRYPYEVIRDNALTASNLIYTQIGGKSFKPYQPAGLWEEKTESPVNNYYEEDKAPDIYRRSMYIYLKRTSPHPSYSAFDGSERFFCQVKRQNTNTPIQALITLNDPQFLEAARVLAQNELKQSSTMNDKIVSVFYKVLSRKPTDQEAKLLGNVYENEKAKFSKNASKMSLILNTGVYPIDKTINKLDLASLSMVAHTIMNLDEAVSRE